MKGHQLVSIKKIHKKRALSYIESPIGFIKGISEEIHSLSPKDRKLRNQVYLKSISPAQKKSSVRDSNEFSVIRSLNQDSDLTPISTNYQILNQPKPKIFHLDPSSKFSIHFHEQEERNLSKLNKELFPNELTETIQYLPDYSPSIIANHLPLETSHRSRSSQAAENNWKISTLYRSHRPRQKVNATQLKENSFTTYSTGWNSFYSRPPVARRARIAHLSHMLPNV